MRRAMLVMLVALLPVVSSGQTGTVMPAAERQFLDNNGDPCAGCKLYAFATGTSTPEPTYSDRALTSSNTHPIVLDSAGRATIFLTDTTYDFQLDSAADVTIWTRSGVTSTHAGPSLVPLHADTTNSATTGTSIETLGSYTVQGGQLGTNGDQLRILVTFNLLGNTNTKTVTIVFGSTTILAESESTTSFSRIRVEIVISRDGASSAQARWEIVSSTSTFGSNVHYEAGNAAISETLSGDLDILVRGTTPSSSNDMTMTGFFVDFVRL